MMAGLVLMGFGLGVLVTIVVTAWMDAARRLPVEPPDSREQVVARLLLHKARRAREVAQLEHRMNERTAQRLRRWEADDDWGQS